MKKLIIIFIAIVSLFAINAFADLGYDTRNMMRTLPLIGEVVDDAQKRDGDDENFHTHESGVYYENVTHKQFENTNYMVREGSLRVNLERLAGKYGWKVKWDMDTDYEVPKGFTIVNRKMPEIFAETIVHLPVRVVFYSKNKFITVQPLYDKRETDVGTKYSINPRKTK